MTSSRQGFLRHLRVSPRVFRLGLNLWPSFRGAGIRVTRVSVDYREIDVTLKLDLFNRNCFGTQFGGSLDAMTDPFHALMMQHDRGRDYIVWEKAGAIRYVKPGRGPVHARFRLGPDVIERARDPTERGARHEPTFSVEILDRAGDVVAIVDKTLHILRHAPSRTTGPAGPVA